MRGKTYTFVVEGGDDKVSSLLAFYFFLNFFFIFAFLILAFTRFNPQLSLQKFAAGYHPFYITDDPEGGYEFKNAQERRKVMIFGTFGII